MVSLSLPGNHDGVFYDMIVPQKFTDIFFPQRGKKMLFVHTPKCGGSSTGRVFGRHLSDCPSRNWPEAAGHKLYVEYRDIFRARGESIHDYYLFSVVRNPFAWHVSWYTYIRSDPTGRKSGHRLEADLFASMSFAEYVDWLEDPQAPRSRQGYMQRQVKDWVCDEDGNIRMDRILRQENLVEDVAKMVADTGIRVKRPVSRRNVSNLEDFRRFYGTREVDRIATRHAADCALFGYSFE